MKFKKESSRLPYILLAVIVGLFAILIVMDRHFYHFASPQTKTQRAEIVGTYHIETDGEEKPLTRDSHFDIPSKETVYVTGRFDREIPENCQILFYLDSIKMNFYINGEEKFVVGEEGGIPVFSKSPGQGYRVFVSPGITPDDQIELRLTNVYENSLPSIFNDFFDNIQYGYASDTIVQLLHESGGTLILSLFLLFVGILLLLVMALFRVLNIKITRSLFSIAGLTIALGIWISVDINSILLNLLFPYPTLFILLQSMALILMTVFFSLYFMNLFHSKVKKLCMLISYLLCCSMIVVILLQMFGVYDLFESRTFEVVFLTVNMLVYVGCLFYDKIHEKKKVNIKVDDILLLVMICGVSLDMVNYFMEFSRWTTMGTYYGFLIFIIVQACQSLLFIKKSFMQAQRAAELESELRQSQISVMLSQIAPHFLFNSLNTISALCMTDPQKAEDALMAFSDYLRGNIEALQTNEKIAFSQELMHIKSYTTIEQMRFGDLLRIKYEIKYEDFEIPTLSLQPIIENAIKHGVGKKECGGTVCIRTQKKLGAVLIEISDDGVGFDSAGLKKEKSVGLDNVKKRLEYISDASLTIRSQKGRGTVVTIRIPVRD